MADRRKIRCLLAVTCALAWLVAPGTTGATHRGQGVPDEVALQMTFQQPSVVGAHGHVMARAVVDDGSPIAGIEVEFLREIDFLGPRLISMGTAATDASGTARVTIDTFEPTILVRVRFAGNDEYLPAEVSSEIHQTATPGDPGTDQGGGGGEPSLALAATVMPPLLAAIATAVWLSLIALTAATVLAIRRDRTALATPRKGRNTR